MNHIPFTIHAHEGAARSGIVGTHHGEFQTPAFMPVGTTAAVKALTAEDLESAGAEIMLGNTYHLYLRPGAQLVAERGGLAAFNGWNKPTLTDSGGFQVFSLRDISRVSEDGVEFRSHLDGTSHFFSPQKSIEIQHQLGADIIMAFDECVPYPCDHATAEKGVFRTTAWARDCLAYHADHGQPGRQHLFGIVQGSTFADLRMRSAEELRELDFPGYAIGGLSVGEPAEQMEEMVAHTAPLLPSDRPRYLMGVGYPENILMAVSYGIDMFDCVLPTRNARTGAVFTSEGQLVYRNAEYARDDRPLDPNCACRVCQRYSRAYLRHLYNASEITGIVLATYHATYFFQSLMKGIRDAIREGRFIKYRAEFLERYTGGKQL